jgi:hypothetical protein
VVEGRRKRWRGEGATVVKVCAGEGAGVRLGARVRKGTRERVDGGCGPMVVDV